MDSFWQSVEGGLELVWPVFFKKQEVKNKLSKFAFCSVVVAVDWLKVGLVGMRLSLGDSLWYDFQNSFGDEMLSAKLRR